MSEFKFAEIEGIDAELAAKLDADEAILKAISDYQSTAIEDGVKNRVEVAKEEFKKKMNALGAKLEAAEEKLENTPDIDPEELKALKAARDKNPELSAQLDALKDRTEKAEAAEAAKDAIIQDMRRGNEISRAINEYDTKYPTVKIKPDAKDLIAMLSVDALQYDDEAKKFKVYKDGELVATDKGAATAVDWLTMLRKDRPSLFDQPAGGGAPGSQNNGSATKKYADMSEAERVGLYKSDPAEFNKLKSEFNENRGTS